VLWWEVARQQEKHAQDMEKKQQLHAAKEEVRQASVDAQAQTPPPLFLPKLSTVRPPTLRPPFLWMMAGPYCAVLCP
jgi:hypothetical protein